jgi:hypothetical protein
LSEAGGMLTFDDLLAAPLRSNRRADCPGPDLGRGGRRRRGGVPFAPDGGVDSRRRSLGVEG